MQPRTKYKLPTKHHQQEIRIEWQLLLGSKDQASFITGTMALKFGPYADKVAYIVCKCHRAGGPSSYVDKSIVCLC